MVQHNKNVFRLFKRGKIWHTYFSVIVSGQRIVIRESTGCSDETAAKEYCARRLNGIVNAPAVTHEITLDAAAAKWYLEYGQYLSNPTEYLSKIKILLDVFDITKPLSQISKADVSNYVYVCQQMGRKPATINRHLVLLSSICSRAKNHWDCNVPNFKILSFKLKVPAEHIKYFQDMDTVAGIINAITPDLQPFFWTAIYTGLRRGRILSLQWQDIDFQNKQIVFVGKNNEIQSVPMVQPLIDILLRIPRQNETVFNITGNPIGKIRRAWRTACLLAGVPYQSFHTLRHTLATWLLRDSHDLRLVKDVLGHKSIQTTLKYAHLMSDARNNAMGHLFENAQNLHNTPNNNKKTQ